MSDDRISECPQPPRCPVCATGFTTTPGASCPACGRAFAPPTAHMPDFRLRPERFRFDGPACVIVGFILVCAVFLLALGAPGLLIPLAILVVPALIRTARLSREKENDAEFAVFAIFMASLGVSILMGVAAGAACFVVCAATISIGGGGLGMLDTGFVAGGVTAFIVFLGLFVAFWPRADTSSRYDHGED